MRWNAHSVVFAALLITPASLAAQSVPTTATPEVTFTKDIAPILQRSCQTCHRPGSVAPMSLLTYEEARPWARSMKTRTSLQGKPEGMPPWFIEKNVGIQHYKGDFSLSTEEIAKIATWADSGAPRGNPADMHFRRVDSVAAFTVWDNRLHTSQQNTHVIVRHYFARTHRVTLDVSYKSGRGDSGDFVRGTAIGSEVDWHRWFVKGARDAHVNYSAQTMWRFGGGVRF